MERKMFKKYISLFVCCLLIFGELCLAIPKFDALEESQNSSQIDNSQTVETNTEPTDSNTESEFGWKNISGKWSYYTAEGNTYNNGIFTIGNKKYIFDKSGVMLSGFQKVKGKIYFFSNTGDSPENGLGALSTYKGWKKIGSDIYYFNNNNSASTGWKVISKNNFYFDKNGKMKTGWLKIGKKSFYLKSTGKIGTKGKAYTGWHTINKNKYYFSKNGKVGNKGKMLTGLRKIGKFKYYFNSSGKLQKNGIVGSKKVGYYYADKKGKIDLTVRKAVTFKGKKWNVLNGKAKKVKSDTDLTLHRALKVVSKVTKKSMSKEKKLKVCFEYVKNAYIEKNPRIPHYHGKNWTTIYANDMFVNGVGNCFSYASAYAYIAKAIGYTNVYVCNSGGHGWTEINGKIYDPEWSRQNYKGAIAPGYSWMHVKI
jgi:glucan-binding YG repeat protein